MSRKIMVAVVVGTNVILANTGILYCLWEGRIDIKIGNIVVIEGKGRQAQNSGKVAH
jgi:hypothetical protein